MRIFFYFIFFLGGGLINTAIWATQAWRNLLSLTCVLLPPSPFGDRLTSMLFIGNIFFCIAEVSLIIKPKFIGHYLPMTWKIFSARMIHPWRVSGVPDVGRFLYRKVHRLLANMILMMVTDHDYGQRRWRSRKVKSPNVIQMMLMMISITASTTSLTTPQPGLGLACTL